MRIARAIIALLEIKKVKLREAGHFA